MSRFSAEYFRFIPFRHARKDEKAIRYYFNKYIEAPNLTFPHTVDDFLIGSILWFYTKKSFIKVVHGSFCHFWMKRMKEGWKRMKGWKEERKGRRIERIDHLIWIKPTPFNHDLLFFWVISLLLWTLIAYLCYLSYSLNKTDTIQSQVECGLNLSFFGSSWSWT